MRHLARLAEATPFRKTTEAVGRMVDDLKCDRPVYVPVMADEQARANSCVLNVLRAIERWGGRLTYGWVLSECPGLWACARFQAMRMTEGGLTADETPNSSAGWTLFAPDGRYGCDVDFADYPSIRRLRTYEPTIRRDDFSGDSARSHRRSSPICTVGVRAAFDDPIPAAIDDCIKAMSSLDALFVLTRQGRQCSDPGSVAERYEIVARSQRRLMRLLDEKENGG